MHDKRLSRRELTVSDPVWQLLYFFLFFSEMSWYNNEYV